jgi:hypothetical protein
LDLLFLKKEWVYLFELLLPLKYAIALRNNKHQKPGYFFKFKKTRRSRIFE